MNNEEEQEIAFLNQLTEQNRKKSHCQYGRNLQWDVLLRDGLLWLTGSFLLILLAHTGMIAGWVMHLGTEILTFRFALRLGRSLKAERRT